MGRVIVKGEWKSSNEKNCLYWRGLYRKHSPMELALKGISWGKRRVCCFCEKWESGGIESFLYNILLHMDLSDLEVDIVAARLEESVFTKSLKACGVGFYELSGKLRSPANGRAFLALLKKRSYDVVYLNIFQGVSFYYGYLAKKPECLCGLPIVMERDCVTVRGRL